MQENVCGWFEIPVVNMDRAMKFYQEVLNVELTRHTLENIDMAWFPHITDTYGTGGALVCNPQFYKPSQEGALLYLSTRTGDLFKDQEQVEANGGTILIPRRQISEDQGYMMIFIDCEGNRMALHSST